MSQPSIDVIHALKSVLLRIKSQWRLQCSKATGKIGHVLPSLRRSPSSFLGPTNEVADVVKFARARGIALVPSGGRTGLSGGAVAANDEVVVSLDKLNTVHPVNKTDRTIRVGAGAITQAIQTAASEAGLFYPVDFASSGSSQIGGNIATNAGGINVIRYGMTREWVAGLTVVTGTGEILELNRGLMKNNTGLDFRHLFIGSEGVLGFITEATLKLCSPPKDPTVLVLGLADMDAIMQVLQRIQATTPLLAYEFFSELAVSKVVKHAGVARPFETQTPFYALIEFERDGEETEAMVFEAVEACMEEDWVLDAVMSQSVAQARTLWSAAPRISQRPLRDGHPTKTIFHRPSPKYLRCYQRSMRWCISTTRTGKFAGMDTSVMAICTSTF